MIIQPITGAVLVIKGGFDPAAPWLVATYVLYVIAGVCWLPVVWLQWRMKRMLQAKIAGGAFDDTAFERLRKIWFLLGWPAFLGLIVVFWLMVTKPAW